MPTPALGAIYSPETYSLGNGAGTTQTFSINNAADEAYVTFVALQTDTITDWDVFVASILTGGRTLEILISEVDADGRPTGVAAGGCSTETVDGTSTGRKTGSFATPASVTAGQQYAILLRHNAGTGTTNIRGSFTITAGDSNRWGAFFGENNAGTYGENLCSLLELGAKYSDGTYVSNFVFDQSLTTFSSASSPNEYAVKFDVPVAMTINGIFASFGFTSVNATADLTLYDTDGTTPLFAATIHYNTSQGRDWIVIPTDADITLTPGGFYRIGVKANLALFVTVWKQLYRDLSSQAGWLNFDAERTEGSRRTGAGAWTDSQTDPLIAGVLIKSLNLATAPTCSATSVSYGAWTRTGPNNTPWKLNFLASDGDNPVAAYEVWTGANRSGTQVASGGAAAGVNSANIPYAAAGLVDGDQTLFLSVDDGAGNVGADCSFTLRRDDVDPTAATAVSAEEV